MEVRTISNSLQEKMRPILESLVSNGVISSFDEEHDFAKVCNGIPYRADYLIRTATGKLLDVEVDNPRHHSKPADDRRDEALMTIGISTVRVSAAEIGSGAAGDKVKRAIESVDSDKPIAAGSTRARRVKALNKRDPHSPSVGIYLSIWHRGNAWGWALEARKQRFVKVSRTWVPLDKPMASACGKAYDRELTREDVAATAVSNERFWSKLPKRCNLRMYGFNVDIVGSLALAADSCKYLDAHNIVSSQRVSQRQYRGEMGLKSNFAILGILEPDAIALAKTAFLEGRASEDLAA